MRRVATVMLGGWAGLFLVVSCGSSPGEVPTTKGAIPSPSTTASNVGGDRIPVQVPGEDYGHHATALSGTLVLEPSGCWTVDLGDVPRIVIFPEGFTRSEPDTTLMVAPDGTTYSTWTDVDARGGIVAGGSLPGGADGFWGTYLAYCRVQPSEVVVVDRLTPSFDPAGLSDEELAAMVEDAELTVSWPCGRGFQISNEEQTVALRLFFDGSDDAPTPVVLPDPNWAAEVRVGKNLMANNCDDVIEGWEPAPQPAVTWPLAGGLLEFTPPEKQCAGAVTARLVGAVVATPTGEVALDDLALVNDAYGCMAG